MFDLGAFIFMVAQLLGRFVLRTIFRQSKAESNDMWEIVTGFMLLMLALTILIVSYRYSIA
jgi:hypothetical protein